MDYRQDPSQNPAPGPAPTPGPSPASSSSGYGAPAAGRVPYTANPAPSPIYGGSPAQPQWPTGAPGPYTPAWAPPPAAQAHSKTKRRPRSRAIEISLIAISLVIVVLLVGGIAVLLSVAGSLGSAFTPTAYSNNPPSNSFSVIRIEGTIADTDGSNGSYNHKATLEHIKSLSDNTNNKGILLYMDTPGGGVYESDEVYRALMNYKEQTSRPVYAYMAATCASGGYYICMAADSLTANYNTTTGSIGVYISLTDTSGLYEKFGVKSVLVRSGPNKGVGTPGVEITPEQQAVYQSAVDESYARFVSLVESGRGMDEKTVLKLSDGRSYTASQALDNNLVDELADWDTALASFEEKTGANPFYTDFSGATAISSLLSSISDMLPRSEAEVAVDYVEQLPTGVPLAYAPGLAA